MIKYSSPILTVSSGLKFVSVSAIGITVPPTFTVEISFFVVTEGVNLFSSTSVECSNPSDVLTLITFSAVSIDSTRHISGLVLSLMISTSPAAKSVTASSVIFKPRAFTFLWILYAVLSFSIFVMSVSEV